MDRERSGAVGGRQQVGMDAQGRARTHLGILVDAVRPEDLLGGREAPRRVGIGPLDPRHALDRLPELPPADGEDPAGAADFLLLRREGNRIVGGAAGLVDEPARGGIEAEHVAVLGLGHRLRALHHVEPEVVGVAAEDVADVVSGHHHQLEPRLLGHTLQPRGAHLAR
ncbi:MAG: hypothetical protein AUI36_38105 [Cyanobacteria bacterium 13_1_40CM_2_61_4]|nr:MAG: hypothetical protein AUI36_38105 [Cyanobacteria bacterium 13_1_40CM_2_61_4]